MVAFVEYLSDAGEKDVLSLIELSRGYVEPPWSGCSFFMSDRCARPISSALAPTATPRI